MGALSSVEQRFLNPSQGDLDTVLPDATLSVARSVIVFNVSSANLVTVRALGSQLIDGVSTKTVTAGASALFVSDGVGWRSLVGGSVSLTTFLAGVDTLAKESGGNLDQIRKNTETEKDTLTEILKVMLEMQLYLNAE